MKNKSPRLLLLLPLALCGCTTLEPVDGAPEVHTISPQDNAKVTIMPDGSRFVVISQSNFARVTILFPPMHEVESSHYRQCPTKKPSATTATNP